MRRWVPALHQYFPGLYIPSCVRTDVIAVLLVVSGFSLETMSDRVKSLQVTHNLQHVVSDSFEVSHWGMSVYQCGDGY